MRFTLTNSCISGRTRGLMSIVIWLAVSVAGKAQKFHFERFTVESGLQNNIVLAVTQDAKGLMWFATSTGIDRFDGNRFVHYPLPLKNNTFSEYGLVSFIVADAKKQIWAASANAIYRYNAGKDVFELPASLNQQLEKGKTVTGFATGNDGKSLLVGNNNGFFVYNTGNGNLVSTNGFNQFVRYVYQDNKGLLWACTNTGIVRFVAGDEKISRLNEELPVLNSIRGLSVTYISQDMDGRYWIVTAKKGLYVYDEIGQTIQKVDLPKPASGDYTVKDVFYDRQRGLTYVSMDGAGVVGLNKELSVAESYQTNEDDFTTLSNNAAYDIFSDQYNRLWVTTYGGGVNVVVPEVQPFTNYQHRIYNNNSLSNNAAKAVTEDAAGNLWFGTRKGISKYNVASDNWQHFNEETKAPSFTSDNILALTGDGVADVWAGTYGGGLLRINTVSGAVTSYTNRENDSSSIGTDHVYAVLYDSKGRVWTGGIRGPLSYLDAATGKFSRVATPVSSVNCIVEDSKGRILTGTEKGVFMVAADTLQNFFPDIVSEKILFIMEYKPGQYWLGTLGSGVIIVSREKGIEKKLKTTVGLPSDVIAGMLKEPNGDVWIGTSKGIAHYQPKSDLVIAYSKADGLAGSQVNYGAAYRTRKGEMVFGTTDGFSKFNPEKIKTKGYAPVIVFTGLTVNNKQVTAGEKDSPLSEQIDETGKLKLKYYQNSITIDFVNTSPSVSGKHLYSWKLDGFDKEWSPPSPVPSAVYTNLNSGSYTLLVRTFSKGQAENTEVRKLEIVIAAPWWRTNWAFAGYLLLLAAGIYAAYIYINNRNARKKYAERLRLNTSISHEIRTPLTLIKGPVSALAGIQDLTDTQKHNLELARKNIDKLEKIISQFIDFQKTGFDRLQMQVKEADITMLADDVSSSFMPLMKEKNIHFTYKRPSEKIILLFDKEKMEKVLNNLISNAVKYTSSKHDITLELVKDLKYLYVHVADTGIGIPMEQQQFLFKGYFRADNTVNIKETGSGIGLNVAKELVELHHGKLTFKSEAGKGSTFTVRIPLQNESLRQYLIKGKDEWAGLEIPEISKIEPAKHAGRKILIAEDNDELRTYLSKELGEAGFKVLAAADGNEGVELLNKHKPDLVITDVMMPGMNGFQLCSVIKRELSTCHIPVIMLTAIHDKDYLLEGYRSGADDYVKKPFEMAYILTRIDNLLEDRTRFRNKIMSVFEQDEVTVAEDADIGWLKEATETIVENLTDPEFSVERLCGKMAMSRSALFRKFKAITGDSPQHYIMQVRLRKAAELLHQKRNNINEVAFMSGFADSKYFSTAFKKQYGKTPSEYVNELN